MKQEDTIRVWRFADAPMWMQRLSTHGGDEDWLALVPPNLALAYVPWLEVGPFGCCDVSQHPIACGYVVFIGAHA